MRGHVDEQLIFNNLSKIQATFTVVAATDVVTSTAHGLQNGDMLRVSSGTTLPTGLSANTDYYVINATTDTFKLSANYNGPSVDITDTGTGTHTFNLRGKTIMVRDFESILLEVGSANSANLTFKVQGSGAFTPPIFGNAQTATNRWDYVQIKDLQNNAAIDGDTGIAFAGTDDDRKFEVNVNGIDWLSVAITAWVAGTIGIRSAGYKTN